jgi:hypothetical protein
MLNGPSEVFSVLDALESQSELLPDLGVVKDARAES